jgi:hypothetical protein
MTHPAQDVQACLTTGLLILLADATEIHPGTETPASTGEHDSPDTIVFPEVVTGADKTFSQVRVQGVETVWTRHREEGYAVSSLDVQGLF